LVYRVRQPQNSSALSRFIKTWSKNRQDEESNVSEVTEEGNFRRNSRNISALRESFVR
jgi:hypothetical protein